MVGVRMESKLRKRLDHEVKRRITAQMPPSQCHRAVICREALEAYLTQKEIMQ